MNKKQFSVEQLEEKLEFCVASGINDVQGGFYEASYTVIGAALNGDDCMNEAIAATTIKNQAAMKRSTSISNISINLDYIIINGNFFRK